MNWKNKLMAQATWQSGALLLLAAVLALAVNSMRHDRLALVGSWSPQAQLSTDTGISLAISLDEAVALFFAGQAVFLDARSPELYAQGHIARALNLPWEDLDQAFATVMTGIDAEETLITYCDGAGCNSSKELAFALLARGYFNVRVLVNGWTLWQDNHFPVELDHSVATQ
jgi:rhodanese-related sulfurtransferase